MDQEQLTAVTKAFNTIYDNNKLSDQVNLQFDAAKHLSPEEKIALFKDTASSVAGLAREILKRCPDGVIDLDEMGKYTIVVDVSEDGEPSAVGVYRDVPDIGDGIYDDYSAVTGQFGMCKSSSVDLQLPRSNDDYIRAYPNTRWLLDDPIVNILETHETLTAINDAVAVKYALAPKS